MVSNRSLSSNQRDRATRPIGLTLFPTGGMWQALSRGDREEARPITGVLAMALIRNLFVGGFVEI